MKTYEELAGETGRRVFYRAERFPAREIFARFPPKVLIDGVPFTLENLSLSGLAATVARNGVPQSETADFLDIPGSEVPVVLECDSGVLFEGTACLRRVERRPLDTLVALSFRGTTLDIPALIHRHSETLIQRELNGGLSHALECVPSEYRRFCADVLHLLRAYHNTLSKFENISRRDGEAPDPERIEALYAAAEQRLLPEWRKLWHEGNSIVRPLVEHPAALSAVKAFTEQVLTPEFMGGPIWNRSYRKPLGYPGDFQMMNYVYEWLPRGATIYERLLHRIGLDVAECIATRMVMIQQSIADMAAGTVETPDPGRVLSLGCGPAQEVVNFLASRNLPRPVEFTLVDQDKDALDYAYRRVFPETVRHDDGTKVHCLQVSFVELIKAGEIFENLPPQDLIYTVGLVDYLSMKRIQRLVCSLWRKVAPGGKLVVGNMADVPGGNLWPMEFLADWSLYYRGEAEMLEMAALVPDARAEIRPDPTGRVYMLYLEKPAAGD